MLITKTKVHNSLITYQNRVMLHPKTKLSLKRNKRTSIVDWCGIDNINQLSEGYRERLNDNKYTYLRTIIKKSPDLGKISETEATSWNCLLDLRNSLVHNMESQIEMMNVQLME